MEFEPVLSTVAKTIQTAIAPVFLLAGIGAILNVMVGRLARIVDRARDLEKLHPSSIGPEHDRHVFELRLLDRRIRVINSAVFLVVLSAVANCTVVAMLFTAELLDLRLGKAVAIAFILSMLLLIGGLTWFLVEVRMSVRAIRVRAELLERERQ
ncbi:MULTISPECIES: DUF2721 domain-containing protein [unclassified Sphingomonas]|uniref:DUF2721 domain-containing protein n=1 Tax=unclassified Sphingomonas TaxID=196159 RepID=UPI0006F2691B|nr:MULTISPECIES: DUF2721 domain-containing protein [unclassified Sphingomonas]KQM98784.1 hypothetical protein ASE78_06035 [Sphingomonas sp. Leaf25]KQN40549.1 hypothetical protein ASE97_01820 [Sphingomonas sp. Leaf42]KQT29904.1 hypothetical protein ASG37_01795 [Sphingomonas sp. Leaf407]